LSLRLATLQSSEVVVSHAAYYRGKTDDPIKYSSTAWAH